MYIKGKDALSKRGLQEAMGLKGGATGLSTVIDAKRTQVEHWLNGAIEIPLKYAVLIAKKTGVHLNRLSLDEPEVIELVLPGLSQVEPVCLIRMKGLRFPASEGCLSKLKKRTDLKPKPKEKERLLVNTEGLVISGFQQVREAKVQRFKEIKAITVDMKALLTGVQTIKELGIRLKSSERVRLGLALEALLQKQPALLRSLKNAYTQGRVCFASRARGQIKKVVRILTTDVLIAACVGFKEVELYQAEKKVLLTHQ